jgi:hypothetical protein
MGSALRRLLTRKPVILPASTGELVKLELGEIDFEWLAEFATRSLCEMYTRFKARPS